MVYNSTLYDRLDPKYKRKLYENQSKWPLLFKNARKALKSNYFVTDLKVSELMYICDMVDLHDWNEIYNIFTSLTP